MRHVDPLGRDPGRSTMTVARPRRRALDELSGKRYSAGGDGGGSEPGRPPMVWETTDAGGPVADGEAPASSRPSASPP